MSRRNRKTHACGHKNYGKFCHRCDRADEIEALLEKGQPLVTDKRQAKPRKWKPEQMKAEVERLRSVH